MSPRQATMADLAGRTFWSTAVTRSAGPLAAGSRVVLSFTPTTVGGSGGCNRMSGDARVAGDRLVVGPLASTEMACSEPLMQQDQWLADLLGSRPQVRLDGDRLVLTGTPGSLELLDRRVADPDRPLVGTAWTLTSLVTGPPRPDRAVSSVPAGVTSTLRLATVDGTTRLLVDTGCNSGGGPVTVGATTLTIPPFPVTLRGCVGDAADVERLVLRVLSGTVDWTVDGPTLTLTAPSGDGLVYTAA